MSSCTTISPQANSVGWHPPSTSLGTQPLGQTQTVTSNPATNVASNPVATATVPNTNFTSSAGQSFAAPQVTNPAIISNQNGAAGVTLPPAPAKTAIRLP